MKICYFGTYNLKWGRSHIYIKGFRENGVKILECHSAAPGFGKYYELWRLHKKIDEYDFIIVGYPGHAVVWFAKIISRKPVIFDAGWTMEEGVVISRNQGGFLNFYKFYIKFIDWLAVKCSNIVLVESEEQRKYFENKFGNSNKYKVVYTGADDSFFYIDSKINKKNKFSVVFRGKFLPEAGVEHVVLASKILENDEIDLVIIGNGFLEKEIKSLINNLKPKNLTLVSGHLEFKDLRNRMLSAHVSLGQFEDHERLERTIPHKCFETLALGLPYVTARTKPVAEILKDGESVIFVNPADSKDLAEKILYLKNNPEIAIKIGNNEHKIYQNKFTPKILASKILEIICSNS